MCIYTYTRRIRSVSVLGLYIYTLIHGLLLANSPRALEKRRRTSRLFLGILILRSVLLSALQWRKNRLFRPDFSVCMSTLYICITYSAARMRLLLLLCVRHVRTRDRDRERETLPRTVVLCSGVSRAETLVSRLSPRVIARYYTSLHVYLYTCIRECTSIYHYSRRLRCSVYLYFDFESIQGRQRSYRPMV